MSLPPNYLTMVQGSPEWLQARIGCVGASEAINVVRRLKKGGYSAARASYMRELLTEMLTGRATENYVSAEMAWGLEQEPVARAAYEIARDVTVEQIGWVLHPRIKQSGCSPDGLVGEEGLVEFKCPNSTTHVGYMLADAVPAEYVPQMAWQIACTGREWCDFCSYDPRLPAELSLFIKRLTPNAAYIEEMEQEVEKFIAELNEMHSNLASRMPMGAGLHWINSGVPHAEIPDFDEVL